jgi:hypothetical protein
MCESTLESSVTTAPTLPANRIERAPIAAVTTLAHTEIGGRDGPDPTRYGDWEKNGRCIDF